MRRALHNEVFAFRAPPILATAMHRQAEERGMTVSELLRDAVRDKVGLNGATHRESGEVMQGER
ncbi:hypothetical protein BV97_04656 [Novosphingobium resinovorum]|jgi:hypothetical protein|uniref:Ribbon-helix-helix protein CopG domain-containing protein n=1 Tax=Novosphingobium resinovorum TaxID=158500 RepID=A0A031JNR3_9SPHN|nr:hypothetical protein BV97_04656 [Novosphingobium resinovorum]